MGLCGGTFRYKRSKFFEKVFSKKITRRYWLITIVTGQLWSLATTTVQLRIIIQLNSVLFAKTLVRKDVASSAPPPPSSKDSEDGNANTEIEEKEDNFSSKAQIMTLMTTDVNRVSGFGWHMLSLVGWWYLLLCLKVYLMLMLDAPMGILIGTFFLYDLLGMKFGLWSPVIFESSFFRCFLLLRSRRSMPIPSYEPFHWKSGRWCVTFVYVPEVWYLALDI